MNTFTPNPSWEAKTDWPEREIPAQALFGTQLADCIRRMASCIETAANELQKSQVASAVRHTEHAEILARLEKAITDDAKTLSLSLSELKCDTSDILQKIEWVCGFLQEEKLRLEQEIATQKESIQALLRDKQSAEEREKKLQYDLKAAEQKIVSLTEKKDQTERELIIERDANTRANRALQLYQDNLGEEFASHIQLFQRFREEHWDQVTGFQLFAADNYEQFLTICAQKETMMQFYEYLWTYLCSGSQLQEGYQNMADGLLNFCIRCCGTAKLRYARQKVQPGDAYDGEFHHRVEKGMGTIRRVLMQGITYSNTSKPVGQQYRAYVECEP